MRKIRVSGTKAIDIHIVSIETGISNRANFQKKDILKGIRMRLAVLMIMMTIRH